MVERSASGQQRVKTKSCAAVQWSEKRETVGGSLATPNLVTPQPADYENSRNYPTAFLTIIPPRVFGTVGRYYRQQAIANLILFCRIFLE